MGMPVIYNSSEGMLKVYQELGIPEENFCTYCIGGKNPFENMTF